MECLERIKLKDVSKWDSLEYLGFCLDQEMLKDMGADFCNKISEMYFFNMGNGKLVEENTYYDTYGLEGDLKKLLVTRLTKEELDELCTKIKKIKTYYPYTFGCLDIQCYLLGYLNYRFPFLNKYDLCLANIVYQDRINEILLLANDDSAK